MRLLSGAILLTLLAGGLTAAQADTRVLQVVRTEPYKMRADMAPAPVDTAVIWMGTDRVALISERTNAILRQDQSLLYVINHHTGTYAKVELPFDMDRYFPVSNPEMREWRRKLEVLRPEITLTPTDETRVINGWPTHLYKIRMKAAQGSIVSDIWTTTEAPCDQELYRAMMRILVTIHPRTQGLAEQMDHFPGVVVLDEQRTTTQYEEMLSIREVIEIREADSPPGVYEPPSGYRETPFHPMRLL